MRLSSALTALLVALAAIAATLWSGALRQLPADHPLRRLERWTSAAETVDQAPPTVSHPRELPRLPLDRAALESFAADRSRGALRWGTYRPGLYFGLRSRSFPAFVSAGLLWGSTHEDVSQLRHECRQEDRLERYGWDQHDGRAFATQRIDDPFNRVALVTSYARLDDAQARDGWAARVAVAPLEPRDPRLRRRRVPSTKLSLFFYVDLGCGDEQLSETCRHSLKNRLEVTTEPAMEAAPCPDDEAFQCHRLVFRSADPYGRPDGSAPLTFDTAIVWRTRKDAVRSTALRYAGLQDANVLAIKDRLVGLAQQRAGDGSSSDAEIELDNGIDDDATLLVVQAVVEFDVPAADDDSASITSDDLVLDVLLVESPDTDDVVEKTLVPRWTGPALATTLQARAAAFSERFETAFALSSASPLTQDDGAGAGAGLNASQVVFAQAAFSNLIGGLGYFYGSSLVQHDPENKASITQTARAPLFTGVPSRSFFPRGFLWDEGFHQLGIGAFDAELTKDVLAHWLALMDDDGYIAREQILGATSRKRVPSEFLVQHVEHANPPALLLAVESLLRRGALQHDSAFLEALYPFLLQWYSWFATTQRGPLADDERTTFRWRGRRADDGKLIANTLSSGLDDYPRASQVSDREMHVDLLCWMIKASDVLASVAQLVGHDGHGVVLREHRARYEAALRTVHWDATAQAFFDVGDHSEDGHVEDRVVVRCRNDQGETRDVPVAYEVLQRRSAEPCPASHPTFLFPLGDGAGGLKLQPVFVPRTVALQHVRHIGYVSVFPLLLQVVAPDAPELGALLEQLRDPEHLWSPFGLRSLSTRDLFYERANAHGDNPYWRGSIWINANFLALRALHHYGVSGPAGPHRERALAVYRELRGNVVATIHGEFERTGFLWEQYSGDVHAGPQYGRGQRCHPFAGWTALVVNIMAEKY
ncbi:hypothetical protein P43SY_000606 [Pythium insidiosum]|uniref:Mannosyl-oligosaccharide glucosidase n=1 Tax=Pythium insidiosum TaxID=114742 RepID=A0AAD5M196_PYTIN|nr:hypothetical protein P43SY_000606 [Pythium insidiosum]